MKKQNKILQIVIFVVSALFLVSASAIALFVARGNSLTPNGGVVNTGTIRVSINPVERAKIFVNEQEKVLTNNNTIDSVAPGEYNIRVTLSGYNDWQQKIEVRSGLVTDVSVQLFPGDLPPEQLTQSNIYQSFFSNSRKYMYYIVRDYPLGGNIGLWQQTLQQSNLPLIQERPVKVSNLTGAINDAIQKNVLEITPSADDTKILVKLSDGYYILDTNRYNEPSATNKLSLPYPVDQIAWLGNSNNNLVILSKELMVDYVLDKKIARIINYVPGETPVFGITPTGIVFANTGKLWRYNNEAFTEVKLDNVQLPSNIAAIIPSKDNDQNFIIQTKDKNIFFLNTLDLYLGEVGKYELVSVSPSARNILIKDGNLLKSVEILISLSRGVIELQRRDSTVPANLNSETISWAPNSTYIIFQDKERTTKIYSADKTGNNVTEIFDSTNLVSEKLHVPADNSGIVVRLKDSNQGAGDRSNLYKLKLGK